MILTKPRKTLATCCGVHAIHDGISDIMYVLLPALQQSFGLSLTEVGLVRGAHRAGLAIFQLPAGLLAERLGERSLLVIGTAIAGLAFVALGYSDSFFGLLFLLFLVGMGSAAQHPLSSSIISTVYPGGGRRAALGTYAFAGDVGKCGIAGGLGLLLFTGIEWREPVIVLGSVAFFTAVVVLLSLISVEVGGRPDTPPEHREKSKELGWGIREPIGFSALCGIMIVDNCTRNGFLTFAAFLLIQEKGVDPGTAGMVVPIILIGGMWGKLACGFLSERIGIIRTVVLTEIGTAAGILAMILAEGMAAFFVLPLLGIALNGTSPVLQGTVGDLVDRQRQSRAFGLFFTISASCGIAAPLGFGILSDLVSVSVTMFVITGLVFLTLPLCLVLRPILQTTIAAAE